MRAMILAAGLGTRLRPLTLTQPKPLVPVAGKPLIVYQIENLAAAGIRELVINHAWLGEQIESCLGDGSRWGVSIRYSPEESPLETAGGIRNALALLSDPNDDTPFMVVNGDVFTEAAYRSLDLNLPASAQARLWLVNNPDWHRQGDFALNESGWITPEGTPRLTFSGISLLRPSLFHSLQPGDKAALAPILRASIAEGSVQGARLPDYWNDVGTHERLAEVEARMCTGVTR